jgi:phospholipase/carboxylesterase
MRIDFKQLNSTLTHVTLPPREPALSRPPLLLLLHGRGADEHDLIPLTHYLDARFFIISVRAPLRFSYGGYAWFEILESGSPEPKEFRNSFETLATFIDDARAHYPVAPGPLFVFGFSMGAMLALAYTLAVPSAVRAVAAHSGYLPDEIHRPYQWNTLRGISIFQAHGLNDPVVPIARARRSSELLSRSDAAYTYKEYSIQHQISEESIADINVFYQSLLGPAPR